MTSTILERHPLDHDHVVKILLGQSASDALAELGPCLVIATKADSTAPERAQGKIVLNCVPISKKVADAAYGVARGSHRAVKIRG
jgi:hypothetical protein